MPSDVKPMRRANGWYQDSDGYLLKAEGYYWVIFDDSESGWVVAQWAFDNSFYECGFDFIREVVQIGPRIMPPNL